MRVFRWMIALLALVAVTAAACGGGDDDTGNPSGGGEGNVSDDLPDDFPDDFPIYDGADFEGSFSGEQDGVPEIVASWTTDDDLDDVRTFYDAEFSGDGDWTAETDGTTDDSSFWSVRKNLGGDAVFVTVASDGDTTSITVIISEDLNDLPIDDDDSSIDDSNNDGTGAALTGTMYESDVWGYNTVGLTVASQ